MRVLVTGGSGFIGSHVVDKLRDAGHTPVIYDRLPSPFHTKGDVDTVIGELDDLATLERAMDDCQAVMHLAAAADVNIVAKEPLDSEACNARGTVTVLEAARQAGVERVVYASTIWVYTGESGQKVDEDSPLGMPNHLYTASKLAGEMYCRSYHELYDLETTILRFGIPYGPRARPAAVIPAFVNKALAGEPLTVAGGGLQSRRFVYVEDLAEGCVRGLEPVAANRIYNLVSDESTTIVQIAELVQELVAPVDIEDVGARTADYVGVEVSGERARRELDWTASTPFREGVRRYVAWRRDQDDPAKAAAWAPVAPPKPARSRALVPRLQLGLPVLFGVASAAMLFAYLAAVHSIGLSGAESRTVGVVTFLGIGLYLVARLETGRREHGTLAVALTFVLVAFVAFAVMLPWSRDWLDLAEPTAAVIALSVTGAGLGIALVAMGLSLTRERADSATSAIETRA
ncbi:MAG TPA: NAD-dependent epimerase/dehydratase family protein [Solirubrobacteraceae bacterium]